MKSEPLYTDVCFGWNEVEYSTNILQLLGMFCGAAFFGHIMKIVLFAFKNPFTLQTNLPACDVVTSTSTTPWSSHPNLSNVYTYIFIVGGGAWLAITPLVGWHSRYSIALPYRFINHHWMEPVSVQQHFSAFSLFNISQVKYSLNRGPECYSWCLHIISFGL